MFETRFKRLCLEALVVGCPLLAGCDDSESSSATDAGSKEDAASVGPKDAGSKDDASPGPTDSGADSATPMTCTGGSTLSIAGNYVATDGSQHWLRKTASATTYARVPAGKADNTKPPIVWKITQVCSTEKAFIATGETGTFARVDWAQTAAGLQLCVAAEGVADAAAALAAGRSTVDSATGCKGAAWTTLIAKDGGL